MGEKVCTPIGPLPHPVQCQLGKNTELKNSCAKYKAKENAKEGFVEYQIS